MTGIFSDIMNLTDCVGFSDSRVRPQQVKTRVVRVVSLMVEKELGERNFGFDLLTAMYNDNCSCPIAEHSRTMALIALIEAVHVNILSGSPVLR